MTDTGAGPSAAGEGTGGVGVVGFIGLGQIGAPMAEHLLAWPGGLVVCDLRPEATEPFAAKGAHVADEPAGVAAAADVICVMVLTDEQVHQVVAELLAASRPGQVIAVHSTVDAGTVEKLAATAAGHVVELIDAPVSGGFMGAHQARLAVMVGGERAAYERVREPFACFADLVVHVGPAGAGTRTKLARNLLHFVAFTAAGEAQRLAEAAGIDLRKLGGIVRHSDAVTSGPGAIILRTSTAEPLTPGDEWYDAMAHTRTLGEKDLAAALALAAELDVDLPLAHLAERRLATELGVPHEAEP